MPKTKPKARSTLPFSVEAGDENVITVRMDVSGSGWEQWFLIQSDEHWDNPDCDRRLLTKHHQEAVARGAGIVKIGDTFCAMQGKYDKRANKKKVRPEHQVDCYFDALTSTAADYYEPYAQNIVAIGDGNHETSVLERHEINLNQRLAATLYDRTKHRVITPGYTFWIRFMFTRDKQRLSRNMWCMHGYGGGGPVTMDMIQANRQGVYIEGADIMASGHTHDRWLAEKIKVFVNQSGRVERRPYWYMKCGTYKDEYQTGKGGWAVGKGHPPKPLGAWWLRWYWRNDNVHAEITSAS